ncbi:serine hydrolase [Marinilongibacter aquaticus]|uniref:serine hydrolase n=1 Tax=Marinilongibacter aquaticus TaxID=2975157 RepID=UPI0021BD5BDD|nr:serine hydrolase [Marinilongibacter aquaticus]UBM57894.1 serine hydrolase [Marinilongibacter aquaticus]
MRKHFRYKLGLGLILPLFVLSSGHAQMKPNQIDSLMSVALKKFNVAGAALGLVKDGKVVYTKGYGVKSVDTKSPVNEHTDFAIASNSKAFTTTALALLVEDGKLNWTDRVKQHIPEFTMYNAYVTENFNVQDLLTHRSGMGLGVGDLIFFPDGANFTIDDLLAAFQHFKPVSAFRTKFDYDNLLYVVAGELVSRVSGMSWEEFVQTRILNPLEMDNTYPNVKWMKDRSNLASPHNTLEGQLHALPDYNKIINGAAGGIYSNVDDLCHWMLTHLGHGKYKNTQLFSEASQREMWKIHSVLPKGDNPRYNSHFAGYGLGWFLTDVLGNMEVSHTGGLPGMLSRTVMIPDQDFGLVILTNTEPGGAALFRSISQTIVDSYLGLDYYDWITRYAKRLKETQAAGDAVSDKVWEDVAAADDSHILHEDFVGIYQDPWFGQMEVFENEKGKLWIKSHRSPKLNGELQFYKANTFAIHWEYQDMNADAFALFVLDENGKAQAIEMKGISPNIDFSFDFHDLDLKRIDKK